MSAGAASENRPDVLDLARAAQHLGIVLDQGDELLGKLLERHELTAREVEQLLIEAVTHRAPPVFGDQHVGIEAPALVLLAQPVKPAREAYDECRQAHRIIDARAAI